MGNCHTRHAQQACKHGYSKYNRPTSDSLQFCNLSLTTMRSLYLWLVRGPADPAWRVMGSYELDLEFRVEGCACSKLGHDVLLL